MDVLPTGTRTLWRLVETDGDESSSEHTYVFEGPITRLQGREYLAEQLRQDGAAPSLGAALSMVESAWLGYGHVYTDEDTGAECVVFDQPWSLDAVPLVLVAKVPHHD